MAWTSTLTDAGASLIASAFGATLNYTKLKLGAGSVDVTTLAEQTDVTDYVKDFDIVGLQNSGATSTINARLTNNGIAEETPLTQMGLFANINSNDEVLLMIYQTDTPSTIPTQEQQPGWVFEPQIDVIVSNVANFTANINWEAYAKISDIQAAADQLNATIAGVQTEVTAITSGSGGINTLNADENTPGSVAYQVKGEADRAEQAELYLQEDIDDLGGRPVIMKADPDHFMAAEARVNSPGNGYLAGDELTLVGGVLLSVPNNSPTTGMVLTILNPTDEYNSDISGSAIAVSGGSGTGMTVTLKTVYAPGDATSIGEIRYTEDSDPLVQKTYADSILEAAENFTTQSLAQYSSGSEIGFFPYGRTNNATALPTSGVNSGTKAFDFSNNTVYTYSAGSWSAGEPLGISDGSKVTITNKFLDGTDIEGNALVGNAGVGLYQDEVWSFAADNNTQRAVDNDTIDTLSSNGAAHVKDQTFSITESTAKFTSGEAQTFKAFWQNTKGKVNGLITAVGNANTAVATKAENTQTLQSPEVLETEPTLLDASSGASVNDILQNFRNVLFWIKDGGGVPNLDAIFYNPENQMFNDGTDDCVMVKINKFKTKQVIDGYTGDDWHPAFIVNGVLRDFFWVAKYPAVVSGGKAYSKNGVTATVSTTFDQALAACTAKGTGWHLWTNAEAAALALLCKKMGFMPEGNNASSAQVNTGTGGNTYFHNNSPTGIWGLNGNIWEWCGGLRLNAGAIQVIKDNDAADNTIAQTAASTAWLPTGFSYPTAWSSTNFESVTVSGSGANGYTQDALKALALLPEGNAGSHGSDAVWATLTGETLSLRGGHWTDGASAGVFALALKPARSYSNNKVGFRAAFVI
jgi:hypothetical protein